MIEILGLMFILGCIFAGVMIPEYRSMTISCIVVILLLVGLSYYVDNYGTDLEKQAVLDAMDHYEEVAIPGVLLVIFIIIFMFVIQSMIEKNNKKSKDKNV